MKYPSSTSSSKSLDLAGFRPWAVLIAAALLLVVELGVARADWVWRRLPRSDAGVIDALEREVIHHAPTPRILVLGNSRMRDAIPPRQLEAHLGLEEGDVLNASLTAGAIHDSRLMYRRNRDIFSGAEVLVVGIEDWNLRVIPSPTPRDKRFNDLRYRIEAYRGKVRQGMIVNWAWRSFGFPWTDAVLDTSRRDRSPLRFDEDGRVVWRDDDPEWGPEEDDSVPNAQRRYERFEWAEADLNCLVDLVREAREDGLHVVVVRPPLRDSFMDLRDEWQPGLEEEFRRRIREALAPFDGVDIVFDERASDAGMPEIAFYDFGHMAWGGAAIYTERLAGQLRELGVAAMLGLPDDPRPGE